MKTYTVTKTFTEPLLKITYDYEAENPRKLKNLGHFMTLKRYYVGPDNDEELNKIIKQTLDYATSYRQHAKLIKKEYEKVTGDKVLKVYPVISTYIYEKGIVEYKLVEFEKNDKKITFFYVVTQKTADQLGVNKKNFKKTINRELKLYSSYKNKTLYKYTLYNENGEIIDKGCNFYDIEDIRKCLPRNWKSENLKEYFTEHN
jgi:hypothetical protein